MHVYYVYVCIYIYICIYTRYDNRGPGLLQALEHRGLVVEAVGDACEAGALVSYIYIYIYIYLYKTPQGKDVRHHPKGHVTQIRTYND